MRCKRSIPILFVLGAVAFAAGCSPSSNSTLSGGSASTAPGTTVAPTVAPATTPAPTTVTAPATAAAPSPSASSAPPTSPTPAPTPPPSPFVQVDSTSVQFVLAGKPFYFSGTNAYYLLQETAYGNTQVVLDALDAAQTSGFHVVRTWGFNNSDPGNVGAGNPDASILQLSPGVYQDSAWKALDFVIAEAAKRDLHLIVTLVNNWDDYGGMNRYVQWAGLSGHDLFYSDPGVKQLYKNYVHDFVNHVSSITGVAYKDDPTIMSWELANEAECKSDLGGLQGTLLGWYAEMSAYLKSLDPNHLVATGEEGFDTTTSGYTGFTSYTTYFFLFALTDGTSFSQNVALPDIDYGGIHLYPDTWNWLDPATDGVNWISDHVKIARAHGKPLLLGEYGLEKSPHSIYKTWLDAVLSTNASGGLLWEFIPTSREAQTTEPFNVIYPTDATDVANLQSAAAAMNAK